MVYKLFGVKNFSGTQNVMLVMEELGVPYEFTTVHMEKGEHKRPEYLQEMHPFGQTPVFVRQGN